MADSPLNRHIQRVLVAPDKFAGTLTAADAAASIVAGWKRHASDDLVTALPMSDGGPGFIAALRAALDGQDASVTLDLAGGPQELTVLRVGGTLYIESAQLVGPAPWLDPWQASSEPLGQAVSHCAGVSGVDTIVIGLGGSGTNDGGAGLLSALGATADVPLDGGPARLRGITRLDLADARRSISGVRLVAALDTDIPLLGLFGATKTYGPQKGLAEEDLLAVDAILDDFVVAATGPAPAERRIADTPGAGAAGGLGFALMLLGADVRRGVDVVAEAVGLAEACRNADLVISGEGTFDHTSRTGKVVYGVAQAAAETARPCVVLAGQVTVGARESRAMGVDAAYAMADLVGLDVAMSQPAESLARLAERTARTWSSRS